MVKYVKPGVYIQETDWISEEISIDPEIISMSIILMGKLGLKYELPYQSLESETKKPVYTIGKLTFVFYNDRLVMAHSNIAKECLWTFEYANPKIFNVEHIREIMNQAQA